MTLLKDIFKLPNFSEEVNWTSSLRDLAGGHTSYNLNENSDITYDDVKGAFTRILKQEAAESAATAPPWLKRIPSNGPWPKYYLEVKASLSADEKTPFSISGTQYDLVSKANFPGCL